MARRLLLLVRAHQITMKATCAMPDTRSSRPWSEETVPVPAEHRDIVSSGGPCSVAALRVAGSARQHVALAQLPFTGSVQRVSAQEPHQRVTQAKVGGSLPHIDNTLNQSSDAGLLREVTFEAPTCFRYWLFPAAITFPRARARAIDPASGAIAVESCPSGSTVSSSLRSIAFGWRRQAAKTFPYIGMEKGGCEPRGPHSVPGIRAFARYCASLRQNPARQFFSLGAT